MSTKAKLVAQDVVIEYTNARTGVRTRALDRVSLTVAAGEFAAIVGPSGCGKTSFLKAVAGLVPIDGGELIVNGHPVTGPGPDRAMVFQAYSLLPWRTVRGNVMYGLELRGTERRLASEKADYFIRLVGLSGFENHYPSELSGGMQQRVNLARALACEPEMLLLDEPFAALDAQTREVMQGELLNIWQRTETTALFITHQIDEAIFLADKVFVFSARPGRLLDAVAVDLPRPRSLAIKRDPRFLALIDEIWGYIEHEVKRATFAS